MKSIVQIELTNHCNRTCSYCGQVNMKRKRGFMAAKTFTRCVGILRWLKQTSVGLNHYGESLLYPYLIENIRELNEAGVVPWLYTNGDLLDEDTIKALASVRLEHLTISGHMPTQQRIELMVRCRAAGINAMWQVDLNDENTLDLAGQVNDQKLLPLLKPAESCGFLKHEKAIVLWDGTLVPCCFDYDGLLPFGSIFDEDVLSLKPSAGKLCDTCSGHPANLEPLL